MQNLLRLRPGRVSRGAFEAPRIFLILTVSILLSIATGAIASQIYDRNLDYQRRGDHFEGLRTRPVAGSVRLISARVLEASQPTRSTWGSRASIRFFLPSSGDVELAVRPLRSGAVYYLLDRVSATWRIGRVNSYSWDTAPVLRHLSIHPSDLGVVVNLNSSADRDSERVLPVVMFGDPVGKGRKSYRFSLKSDARVRVNAKIYKVGARLALYQRPANTEEPGSPFTIQWRAPISTTEGWYRLILNGAAEDGTKVDKEIIFYHRPVLGAS